MVAACALPGRRRWGWVDGGALFWCVWMIHDGRPASVHDLTERERTVTASPANRKAAAEAALQAWGKRASNGDGNGSGSKTQQPALQQQQQAAHGGRSGGGGRRLDRLRLIPCGDHVDLALIEVHGPSGLYLRAARCPFEQSRKGSGAGLVTIHDFLSYFEP